MIFEAARVRHTTDGKEIADEPEKFSRLDDALAYVENTPVSKDGNRPWIYRSPISIRENWIMIGGERVTS